MIPTYFSDVGELTIPGWVIDIDSFRKWVDTADFPELGRIWWYKGKVWADMSREQIFTHNGVKTEFTTVLHGLAKAEKRGRVFSDGILLSNFEADISGNPDLTFVSFETLASDKIRLLERNWTRGYVEIQGSPDMVLEVLSKSSEHKDAVVLRKAYWRANIREYWLVDARKEPLAFDILRHAAKGYTASRKQEDWVRSSVFRKWFRFTQAIAPDGHPEYTLEVK
jgi:Uma2 family endonuclease